jgi:site-specific recombinase
VSLRDLIALLGIVGGPGAIIAAFVSANRARVDKQATVLTTGETGVRLMDFVVERLERQLRRADEQLGRCEERFIACEQRVSVLTDILRDKDVHIRDEQATHRRMIDQKDEELRRLRGTA